MESKEPLKIFQTNIYLRIQKKLITARQCIKDLPIIAKYKPDLKKDIENSPHYINLSKYKENMQSLIIKDIQKTLDDIYNI